MNDDLEREWALAVSDWNPDSIDWGKSEPADLAFIENLKAAWRLGFRTAELLPHDEHVLGAWRRGFDYRRQRQD